MDEPKTILVIAWGGIGDIVCLSPALLALRKRYHEAKIVILCENNTPCELIKCWNGAYTFSIKEKKFKGFSGKIRLIKKLRQFYPDVSVMNAVGPSFRSAFISVLSGARIRIGKSVRGKGFLNTIRFPEYRIHEIDANFEIFKYFGVERADEKPFVQIPEDSFLFVNRWCKDRKITPKEVIGIHPGASDRNKRWDKFSELIRSFMKEGERLVIFGSEDERSYIETIAKDCREGLSYLSDSVNEPYGQASIFSFIGYPITYAAAMISCCKLFIGNDSGPSHLASALSVPTITIFGPTSWERGRPYGDKSIIVKSNLPCSPCSWLGVGIKCKSLECLKEIKVGEVYEKAMEVLGDG